MKTDRNLGTTVKKSRMRRRLQCGMTLVTMAVSFCVGGIALTGGWMSYMSYKAQWKASNVERMMDQYASSAMQEMTNNLSWAWSASPGGGGAIGARWKFYMDDIIQENGNIGQYRYYRPDNSLEIRAVTTQGLYFNDRLPSWSNRQYLWTGYRPGYLKTGSMDHRDRMTVETWRWISMNTPIYRLGVTIRLHWSNGTAWWKCL